MDEQPTGPGHGSAFRGALRVLRAAAGTDALRLGGEGAPPIERAAMQMEPPAIAEARVLEGGGARAAAADDTSGVAAFLDGIQRTRVAGHWDGVPLLVGTVAAAVRRRVDRRLVAWEAPRVHTALYAPRTLLGEARWARLLGEAADGALPVVDVAVAGDAADAVHPLAVRTRALELVALERERAERALAAAWCGRMAEWLWIDGGVAGNLALDERAAAFGVVKSHATLYGDAALLRTVLTLRAGHRSPLLLVGRRARRAVASWYLRLREAPDGDPLHGLVRVEVVPPAALLDEADAPRPDLVAELAARADRLSSWILRERSPVSRPDQRWDTLAYGVHATEGYLAALVGS